MAKNEMVQTVVTTTEKAGLHELINKIESATKEDLDEMMVAINERRQELKREEFKEILMNLRIGKKIVYTDHKEELEGDVISITEKYVGVSKEVDKYGNKSKRISLDQIIRVIEE